MHFDGVSGSIIVSFIAFSIVFAVLLGLTCMIFAMKLFAGSKKPAPESKPAPAAAPAAPAVQAVQSVQSVGNANSKIVAAITAAIIEATNGMGRITAITPELAAEGPAGYVPCARAAKRWKTAGVVRLVDSVVDRGWRR